MYKKIPATLIGLWMFALLGLVGGLNCSAPQSQQETHTELVADSGQENNTERISISPEEQTKQDTKSQASSVRLQRGIFALEMQTETWTLRLLRNGEVLAQLALDGLQLGFVADYNPNYNYNPYQLAPTRGDGHKPVDLEWLIAQKATLLDHNEQTARILLEYRPDIEAVLEIEVVRDGTFALRWLPTSSEQIVFLRLRWEVDREENYYGLGEYFDQVAHRGTRRAMQIEIDLKLQSGYNEAHIPVPFFTGTRGWGVFVRSYRSGAFDMGRGDPKYIDIIYHDTHLEFFVLAANHPLEVPGLYTRLSGAPAVPATWAFGTMLWRDENRDQAEVLDDAAQIRKHDLAISSLWIDRPYDTAVNNFSFDPARYPDPQAMINQLHAQGFRLGLWSTPYAESKSRYHEQIKQNDWFVKLALPHFNKWSAPVDLTNPAAFAFWQSLIENYTKMGIEGFKLDYGEDIQLGLGPRRAVTTFHNGEDERSMHHKYAIYYHRAYAEKLPKEGGFLLCRGGTFGSQQYASIIWPGDLNTGFQKHYECPPDPNKPCYVGGLPASIIAGLSLSQSGFPFYGSDTGGYRDTRPTKRVFARWGQQTALSTIMQIGGADPNVNPWDFKKYGESQFDQQLLDIFRNYIRLHTRLFPYIYTYALAANRHEIGPTRPYGMQFPTENYHPNDQYFLGPFLMVAPIVDHKDDREIQLPHGFNWVDWWDLTRYRGGQRISYSAPLEKLPLFMREGSIIPMLRPDIDTLAPVQEQGIISLLPTPGRLHLRIVPGNNTEIELYDNTKIELRHDITEAIDIAFTYGKTFQQGFALQILRLESVQRILASDKALPGVSELTELNTCPQGCWLWDQSSQILYINLPYATYTKISIQAKIREDIL
jgi:alpha-D-xyloside xylohydrolase